MSNLANDLENLVRKYKLIRLQDRNYSRINRREGKGEIELKCNEFISELEMVLGYEVHSDPKKQVRYTIQDRLEAIESEKL
jgi:hypothetical protein